MTARGLNPKTIPRFEPKEMVDSIEREAIASNCGWKPSQGLDALYALTPEWEKSVAEVSPKVPEVADMDDVLTAMRAKTVLKRTEPLSDADARSLKLKLMQDLMEQLRNV